VLELSERGAIGVRVLGGPDFTSGLQELADIEIDRFLSRIVDR
jgi:hypothetical protein